MKYNKLIEKLNKKYHPQSLKHQENLSNTLKIIGITGSRGKSSVAYLVSEYLKSINKKVVLYSSIKIDSPYSYKTPQEAVENPLLNEEMLYNALIETKAYNAEYLILEVNEKAIKNNIIDELDFDVCLLTNIIDQQNEEYDDYIEIKKDFLRKQISKDTKLILSVIDPSTYSLYQELINNNNIDNLLITSTKYFQEKYNLNTNNINTLLLPYKNKSLDTIKGLNFNIQMNNKLYQITSNLLFPHNALNILNTLTIINTIDELDINKFNQFIKEINIPGRTEIINHQNKMILITINIEPILEHLYKYKELKDINNIILITGSTGSGYVNWKNNEKRKKIHEYDIKYAYSYIDQYVDMVYITENDHGEENKKDFLEYQQSLLKKTKSSIILDREEAIINAINNSSPKDVIVISGRGNRKVMCTSKNKMKFFKDIDKINEIINSKGEK